MTGGPSWICRGVSLVIDSLLPSAYEYGDANRGLKYTAISRTILSDENGHRRARDEDASR
jgi:hypothetical protein